ncbi:hypothetical protein K439DRAFT_1619609 [Ramaria rubella]|nr:hypothetical protein K439DRAFT_1619609 [Ramaria rubella]
MFFISLYTASGSTTRWCSQDSDILNSASPFIHVTFATAEDADAIPLEGAGKVIQLPAPKVDINRNGGVGLDDLHTLLDPEPRERNIHHTSKDQRAEAEQTMGARQKPSDRCGSSSGQDPGAPILHISAHIADHSFVRSFQPTKAASEPPICVQGPPFVPSRKTRYARISNVHKKVLGEAIPAFGGFAERPSDMRGGRTSMYGCGACTTLRRSLPTKQPRASTHLLFPLTNLPIQLQLPTRWSPWPSHEIPEESSSTPPSLPSIVQLRFSSASILSKPRSLPYG